MKGNESTGWRKNHRRAAAQTTPRSHTVPEMACILTSQKKDLRMHESWKRVLRFCLSCGDKFVLNEKLLGP